MQSLRLRTAFKLSVRMSSTDSTVLSLLEKDLERYFGSQRFSFAKIEHKAYLRAQMELVYLRRTPLVAVDVEAYERNPKKITEIGVAIYDPRDQYLSAMPHIRTLHIINQEHKTLLNKTYVPNRKHLFNGGTSYELDSGSSKATLTRIFNYYLNSRKGVLVGHNVAGDIRWLAKHGIKNSESLPTVDTQKLYQLSRKRGATLRGILRHVGIMHSNLHNAANDAYYTMLAAMKYCDPTQRQALGLDTYDSLDHPMYQTKEEKKQDKRLTKQQKFSDQSDVVLAVPDMRDFLPEDATDPMKKTV